MEIDSPGDPWDLPRQCMVRQLHDAGIRDARVLQAMREVPRHRFMPEDVQDLAYADRALPIGWGQTISQPYLVARMAELLDLHPNARVLDIGGGSGYAAAVYSRLAARVISIERVHALAEQSRRICTELEYTNLLIVEGDGTHGYPQEAPYQAIAVAAAALYTPPALLAQLADGGHIVIPLGLLDRQELMRLTRHGEHIEQEHAGTVSFVPFILPKDEPGL